MISSLVSRSRTGSRRGELRQDALPRIGLGRARDLVGGDRPPRLVLVDLLDEADLLLVERAVGGGHGDHRLQDEVGPQICRSFRHGLLLETASAPIVPRPAAFANGRKRAFERLAQGCAMTRATRMPRSTHSPPETVTPLKVIFLADTRPGHYHLAEGVIAAIGAPASRRGHPRGGDAPLDRADAVAPPAHQRARASFRRACCAWPIASTPRRCRKPTSSISAGGETQMPNICVTRLLGRSQHLLRLAAARTRGQRISA